MKRKIAIALCTLCSIMVFSACGAKKSEDPKQTDTKTAQSETNDKDKDKTPESEEDKLAESPENVTNDATVPGHTMEDAMLLPLGDRILETAERGTDYWYAFTTGDAGTTYNITFTNASTENTWGAGYLKVYLCDKNQNVLKDESSEVAGTPKTITTNKLEPNTLYYLRINSEAYSSLDYSLIIKDPNDTTTAYETAGDFSISRGGSILEDGIVTAGTYQGNATILPFGVNASGTINSKSVAWFGFTTDENENSTYNITFETPKKMSGRRVEACLYDEYGTKLTSDLAHDNGEIGTISANQLNANTTYYIRLLPGDPGAIDYSLFVESSEGKDDSLVFEVPFEINETQVKFVINSDKFIDTAKAKEALKPVADAILEHPDNSILIAGTTATDGTQASCVDLANRRANAVKKLLMNTYGVPEKQLKTIGLGYERDPFERGKDRDSNGDFVESEGKKNRRVVILDIEDPIAQEILKNNK